MVNYSDCEFDRVFAALGDPTRRAILSRLEQVERLSVSEIAKPMGIKLPTMMKHLNVLGEAGLVSRSKHGRTVEIRLSPAPLREALRWLGRYDRAVSPAQAGPAAHVEFTGHGSGGAAEADS